MSRLKSTLGWVVRGGDQTRSELAAQAAAIQELQTKLDVQTADADRVRAELRGALDDVSSRLAAIVDRLDRLEAQVADHDAAVASLARVVAPPADA
jgi:uncharacterized coiled-coil protein SlyX